MMKKKLLIIRHAKAENGDFKIEDFDRPLSQTGIDEAEEMGQKLLQKNIIPDGIVSSPALRAISTAQLISNECGFNQKNIILEPNIYEASVSQILKSINNIDNSLNFVALLGHNPGLTMLARDLTNADISDMPTCGMVMVEFELEDWEFITAGTGNLLWEDSPRSKHF